MPDSHDTYIKKTKLAGKTLRITVYFYRIVISLIF